MQKIVNEEEKARKTKRTQMVVSIVLVAIMVLSTAGYALLSGERTSTKQEKISYNGFDFTFVNNAWYFTTQGKEFLTSFNPSQTENITGSLKSNIQSYLNKPVYFEEGSDVQGLSEISRNLGQLFSRVQYACLENCTSNNPVKNCSDNVISVKPGETLIKQQANCVYISSQEILR
ncbi:MAG: hypothetical protein NT076_04600, partial [Candidatus Pacearchaeota archaeon]|nr:hypothetical protein [Candidatus Pacearchaeota archaeon]